MKRHAVQPYFLCALIVGFFSVVDVAAVWADSDLSLEIISPSLVGLSPQQNRLFRYSKHSRSPAFGVTFSIDSDSEGRLGMQGLVSFSNGLSPSLPLADKFKIYVPGCATCRAGSEIRTLLHTPEVLELN